MIYTVTYHTPAWGTMVSVWAEDFSTAEEAIESAKSWPGKPRRFAVARGPWGEVLYDSREVGAA